MSKATDAGRRWVRADSTPAFDMGFHLVFVVIALTNFWLFYVGTQRTQPPEQARAETWWSLLLLGIWLLPSLFYVRTWAGGATSSLLWARAPVVQFVGVLVAAIGAVAALLRLLGGILLLLAQRVCRSASSRRTTT